MRTRKTRSSRRDPIHLLIEQLERREVVSETLSALASGAAFAAMVPPVARQDVPAGRRPSYTQSASTPAPAGMSWAVSLSAPAPVEATGRARAVEPLPSVAAAPWSDPFAEDAWADETAVTRPQPQADDADEPRRGGGDAAPQFTLAAVGPPAATPPVVAAPAPAPLPVTGSTAASSTANAGPAASVPAVAAPAPRAVTVPAPAGDAGVDKDQDGGPGPEGPLNPTGGSRNYVPASLQYPSYVIDANKGVVLSEAVVNHDYSEWAVDLRAQVIGATVVSYSWNFDYAGDTTNRSATNTYRMTFDWTSFSGAARENMIALTVDFGGGKSHTQEFHFLVAATDSEAWNEEPPTTLATWPAVVTPDTARADAAAVAGPHHAVDLVDGSVWAAVELPAYNPGVAPVRLVYNSLAADPRPTFLTRYEINPAAAVPATVDARLTVNGTPVTTYTYDTDQTNKGDFLQIALQANATGLATGRYTYSVKAGSTTFPGSFNVVNDAASPFGAGWWVEGVDRIVPVVGDDDPIVPDVVLVSAGGRSLFFDADGDGGDYVTPAGDFSALEYSGGAWTRTLRDGTVVNFNSSGQQVSVVDRNGNTTTYAYSSGRLSTITDPNNLTTTFAYTSGRLATITDPALRTTTFTVADETLDKLTGVVDPEGGTWTYAYDSAARLTRIDQPRMVTATIAYSTTIAYDALAHRAATVTQADGAVEEFAPLQLAGFPAASGPTQAVLTAAAAAVFEDGNNHDWARRLDWAGYGRTTQLTDPEGGVGVMYRDADGLAWLDSDPNGNRTDYHYSADGDVLQVTWADDAREAYTYDEEFGDLTGHANPINHRTTYAYDGGGNLTSVRNALDELTTMTYDGDGNLTQVVTPRARAAYGEGRAPTYTTGNQTAAAVAMDADGDYVVAWASNGQDGSSSGVYAQRYSAQGVARGAEFRVNTTTTGSQGRPAVAMSAAGDFVIAWDSGGQDGSGYGVYAQRYNAAGTAQGSEFRVNTHTTGNQRIPSAAINAAGDFVLAWASNGQDLSGYGVYAQRYERYDLGGAPQGAEFRVNTYTTAGQGGQGVAAAMDASGDFVVAWDSSGQDGSGYGVYAQRYERYDLGGDPQGSEFRVNTVTAGNQRFQAVAMDEDGDFVVAWTDADASYYGVSAQRYKAAGTTEGAEFRVNQHTTDFQQHPSLAMDAAGDLVAAWHSYGQDGSGYGVYARRYAVTAVTRFEHDSRDRVTTVTDAEGGVTTFGYDTAGNVTTVADPLNRTTTYTFSAAKVRLNAVTLPDDDGNGANNPVWEYVYYPDGLLHTQADPDDKVTTVTYDGVGRLASATRPLGLTTAYDYDDAGNLKTVTDPLSRVTTYVYDDANRMVEVLAPNTGGGVLTTAYDYDFGGRPVKQTDPNDRTTTFTWTERDQPDEIQFPNLLTADTNYCKCGCPDEYILKLPATGPGSELAWEYDLDDLGRVVQVTDPLDHLTTIIYDPAGNVAEVRDGLGHSTVYEYDGLNRLKRTTNALGHATEFDYDAAGNRTAVTDALGHAQVYTYDAQNRVKTSADGNSDATTFAYDLVGRLLSVTDAENNVTTYHYDAAGRMDKTTDPNGEVTTYSYTDADELEYVIDREGRRREFTYDGQSRVRTEVWKTGGGTVVYTATYTYDRGRLESAEDTASEYNYGYAANGDLETVDNSGTPGMPVVELEYDFDAYGLLRSVSDNLGATVTYDYEGFRLTTLTLDDDARNPDAYARVALTYDAADRLRYISRSEGTEDQINTTLTYDAADRLTSILHTSTSPATLSLFTYAYDAADRLTRYDGFEGVKTYTYDNADQLTGVAHATTPETFTYDDTGNRTAAGTYTYATGTGNRLLSDGVYSYSYDKEGNTTAKWKSGERWEYKWDHRNRLTEVKELTGVGGTVVYEADYTYDVFDRRIGVLEDEDGAGVMHAAEQTWTVYERDNAWADFDGDDELTARYLNGLGMDERYARVRADGSVAWYLGDNLGSVRQVVETDGTVLNTLTYSAFGTPTETNAGDGDRFKYTGREWDDGTGQYYYRARYYAADVGRFRSEDPIGFDAGDPNTYRYVNNRPVSLTDPSGLCPNAAELQDIRNRLTALESQLKEKQQQLENLNKRWKELEDKNDKLHAERKRVNDLIKKEIAAGIPDNKKFNELVEQQKQLNREVVKTFLDARDIHAQQKRVEADIAKLKDEITKLQKIIADCIINRPPLIPITLPNGTCVLFPNPNWLK